MEFINECGTIFKMHNDAYHIDESIVRKLVNAQFGNWSHLTLRRIDSTGTDNAIFRLGDELCIRLPLIPSASEKLSKELACLPFLPALPLEIPRLMGSGNATEDYHSRWAVHQWIDGNNVQAEGLNDMHEAAESLANFICILHSSDASMIPSCGQHNNFRGCPLAKRDKLTRQAISNLSDIYDAASLQAFWENALTIPTWTNDSVPIHGDIHAGNLLMKNGEITAVLDFGLMGFGDPAVDLIVNWSLLPKGARERFRDILKTDDDTWFRGRSWAFSTALIALSYYHLSNRFMTAMSKHVISEVLEDFRSTG